METFRLQNLSGLFLTCRAVVKENNDNNDDKEDQYAEYKLFLEKEDFSENQIWYVSKNRIVCGNGKFLQWSDNDIRVNNLDSYYQHNDYSLKFSFHHIKHDKFYIGIYGDNERVWKNRLFNFEEEMEPSLAPLTNWVSPFIWRKVVCDPSYGWVSMDTDNLPENSFPAGKEPCGLGEDKSTHLSNDLNVYVGRCLLNGFIHIGKVRDGNRYVGFHHEDDMGAQTFYLQSESGLYLTNHVDDTLALEELDFSHNQIWYWDYSYDFKKDCRGRIKNMLKCGNGRYLQMLEDTPETVVVAGITPKEKLMPITEEFQEARKQYEDNRYQDSKEEINAQWEGFNVGGDGPEDNRHLFYGKEIDDEFLVIGRFIDRDRSDLKDQTFFGFSKTEDCLPMMRTIAMKDNKWKMIPTNQNYRWVTMDKEGLPENILGIWEYEGEVYEDEKWKTEKKDIYMCCAQVNGKIHPGIIYEEKRYIGRKEEYWSFYKDIVQNFPSMSKFGDVCHHCFDLKNQKFNTEDSIQEKFSALCIDPGASVEWVKMTDINHTAHTIEGTPSNALEESGADATFVGKEHAADQTLSNVDEDSQIPKGAVIAGVISGHVYYVGRGTVYNGTKLPGIINPNVEDGKLEALQYIDDHNFANGGYSLYYNLSGDDKRCEYFIDLKPLQNFEILVVKKEDGEELKTKMDKTVNETRYLGLDNLEKAVTNEPFCVLQSDPEAAFDWVEYEPGKLPKGAVVAGVQEYGIIPTGVFYVGRGIIRTNTPPNQEILIPGMFLHNKPSWEERTGMEKDTLYCLYDGRVLELENFQVLVVTKHAQPKNIYGKPIETNEDFLKTSNDMEDEDSCESSGGLDGLPKLPRHVLRLGELHNMINVAMSKDNRFIYTQGEYEERRGRKICTSRYLGETFIKIWDMNKQPERFTAHGPGYDKHHMRIDFEDLENCGNMKLSQDSNTLIVSGVENKEGGHDLCYQGTNSVIQVVDLSGTYPTFKTPLKVLTNECVCLAVSSDGRLCYICQGRDRAVRVWDLHNQECVGIFAGHTGNATCVDLSKDGTTLWSGGNDKTARMWDMRQFGQIQKFGLDFVPAGITSSPSGDWSVVQSNQYEEPNPIDYVSYRSDVIILQASNPERNKIELQDPQGRGLVAHNVKVSNSGKWLLAPGGGMLFSAPSGSRMLKVEGYGGKACCISDDDTHFVLNNKVYKL